MGKTGKWLKNFLTGKKEKDGEKVKKGGANQPSENPTTPIAIPSSTPKEKKRWSFRRSANPGSATKDAKDAKDSSSVEANATISVPPPVPPQAVVQAIPESENELKNQAMAMEAAPDAAVAASRAAAAVIRPTTAAKGRSSAIEETAAIKIQSVFRSYLARKALCALKGLVKLQALVRGHLVRKQATATLRCMQALVTVQARARAQRIRMADESPPISERQYMHRRSPQDSHYRQSYNDMDRGMEENIKIVEMDLGQLRGGTAKARNSYSHQPQAERMIDHRFSTYYSGPRGYQKHDHQFQASPAPSALTEMSPRASSGHFEEYSFDTTQSSPQYYSSVSKPDSTRIPFGLPRSEYADSMSQDYSLYPNYMANTESSRAKVRSQSAPKQRPDSYERQPSKRRISLEGRNIPRAVRMQRSSSHVGSAAQGYQHPWSVKLDRSAMSLKDSECGSTSTILTNTNYCRSLVAYEQHGIRY